MRVVSLCLSGLIFCSLLAGGQHPVPPGIREADKLPNPADVPPQVNARAPRRSVDPAQLQRDANELAKLAQSIPRQVEQVARGRLPKDLNDQLRRIEKLSKQLRHELAR